jgi:hypothetical protein
LKQVLAAALLASCGWALVAIWLERPVVAPPPTAVAPAPTLPEPAPPPEPPPAVPSPVLLPPAAGTSAVREPVSVRPEPDEPLVSLDDLLRVPSALPSGPQSVEDPRDRTGAPPSEQRRPGRLRLEYSRETLLDDVPTEPKRRRTDLGVSVRVDEADRLRVRGGVRVDESERFEAERESEATPTLGVEVRF